MTRPRRAVRWFVALALLLALSVGVWLVWQRVRCGIGPAAKGQVPSAWAGHLPADRIAVDASSRSRFGPLFADFFVVRDGATDCSFVASLMLMLRRDPDYPFRVLHAAGTGYAVGFPGLRSPIFVTTESLDQHRRNWEKTRPAYRRLWPGHIPPGLEILRAAYYDYQARAGIRGEVGSVHDGGLPARDLIVLGGVPTSTSITADCDDGTAGGNFERCPAVRSVTGIKDDGTFTTDTIGAADAVRDGLDADIPGRLLVASSSMRVPRFGRPRLVSNHAYYYLGRTEDGQYLLGDAYKTRCPVPVTVDQFRRYFRAVDYIDPLPAPPMAGGGATRQRRPRG